MTERRRNKKKESPEIKTFSVPYDLGQIKDNISIPTIASTKPFKEQIINQAIQFHLKGNILEATKYYQQIINQGCNDYRVFSNYGAILRGLGKLKEAELSTRKAIELKPDLADAHINLGIILNELGKLKEAEISFNKAIKINPNSSIAYHNLGNILKDQEQLKVAELSFRKAIELNPDFADSHLNLGTILRDLGKLQEAESSTRKAIKIKPDYVKAFSNLASILKDLGKLQEAESSTRKAIKIKPDFANAHYILGNILRDLDKLQEAELSYRKAIKFNPDFADAYYNLGNILRDLGKTNEAIKNLNLAIVKKPNNLSQYINSTFNFSKIMKDISQIEVERENYKKQIQLLKNKTNLECHNENIFNTKIFYLPYHNMSDDKIILEELSNTLSKINRLVNEDSITHRESKSSPKNYHIKVGICSEFLRSSHVVGKLYIKVLLDLLKTDLEIIIYVPPGIKQFEDLEILKKSFRRIVYLPKSPINAKKEIIKDNLDILFYTDIGMSNYTYILALSRLALIQVNSLGHTNTSGIKNMDYFITSDMEPTESNQTYTERLIRFSRLPFNYSTPTINETNIKKENVINSKKYFNIGLMQTLFKLHPDYDEILLKILKEIPQSRIILIKDRLHSVTEGLKERWRKKNELLLKRSIFLDRMSNDNFLNTIKNCDIMLDPLYYGSGNTFYESMAFGKPFITYKNQKSKIPIAGYKQMKIINPPIASTHADYINLCKDYAKDKNLLTRMREDLIEKSNQYLFNDNDIYMQYYKFFNAAVETAMKGKYLSSDWCP